jgi:transposase-like protein
MVTIATYNDPAKAKHLKRRFQEGGVKVDVNNEANLQSFAFMSRPQANVKVKVDEKDFERAQQLMVEWEASDSDVGSAIRCPQCNSPRIEYPQLTRKVLTPGIASVLFAMKIFPKQFYCQNCQFTWSNEEERSLARLWYLFFPRSDSDKRS